MSQLHTELSKLLADTYALYLKTQKYHWHVKGPQFKTFHLLFEEQYLDLAEAVDEIAERILTLGGRAPATFSEFVALTSLEDGKDDITALQMVEGLHADHQQIIKDINQALKTSQAAGDEGTVSFLGERIAAHEKIHWMLGASRA